MDRGLGADIHARGRLLEDEHAQAHPEPPADHDLLLVSAGQCGDGGLAVAGAHREPFDQGGGLGTFAAGADPAQRRQASRPGVGQEVLPYGQLGEAALPLSVTGHEGDTESDGLDDRTGTVRAAAEKGTSVEEGPGTREGSAQVPVSGAREADQAQGFPGPELQADRSRAGGPYAVEGQDGRAGDRGRGGVVVGQLLADDVVHQTGRAPARQCAVADETAVAQDGEGVGDLVHLVQTVAHIEDAVPPVAQCVQDTKQPGAVRGGEAGGRLVEDDELRPSRQGSCDGDQ